MIPERYCYYYYYYFGKKRHNVKTEHIVNKLKENRLKKDKLKKFKDGICIIIHQGGLKSRSDPEGEIRPTRIEGLTFAK